MLIKPLTYDEEVIDGIIDWESPEIPPGISPGWVGKVAGPYVISAGLRGLWTSPSGASCTITYGISDGLLIVSVTNTGNVPIRVGGTFYIQWIPKP